MSFQHDPAVWYDVSRLHHEMLLCEAEEARMANRVQRDKGWSLALLWPFWRRQSQQTAHQGCRDGVEAPTSVHTVSVTHA
jgi:hypothetical protein